MAWDPQTHLILLLSACQAFQLWNKLRKKGLILKKNLHQFLIVIIFSCIIAVFFLTEKNRSSMVTPNSSPVLPTEQLTSNLKPEQEHVPIHVSDTKAYTFYENGLKLYYERNFTEALGLFDQALSIDPQCYEALNAKGAALAFQGHYDQGLALIQQALAINPSFVYANFNLGLANELAGRWEDSISAYQKALQLDNRDTWSYYGIASIYGRQGNVEKVLEYLKPAIELDKDVKEVARNEHDFAPVRQDPRFQDLIEP